MALAIRVVCISFVTELTTKWFGSSVYSHMNIEIVFSFKSLIAQRTRDISFFKMDHTMLLQLVSAVEKPCANVTDGLNKSHVNGHVVHFKAPLIGQLQTTLIALSSNWNVFINVTAQISFGGKLL